MSRVEISNHSESEARTHPWRFQLPIFLSPETTRNIGTNRTQQKVSFTGMAVYLRSWDQGILCRVQALQSTQITSSYRHLSVDANRCCSKVTWCFGGEGFDKARKVPRTSASQNISNIRVFRATVSLSTLSTACLASSNCSGRLNSIISSYLSLIDFDHDTWCCRVSYILQSLTQPSSGWRSARLSQHTKSVSL